MKKRAVIFFFVLMAWITVYPQSKLAVREYDLGDWLTIKNCNYVTSLSESHNYIFFGTLGGVIPYHKYNNYEEPAYTTSDGMSNDEVTAVYFDNSTQFLWAGHRLGISFLAPSAEKWVNAYFFRNRGERALRIGSYSGKIVVQTSASLIYLNNLTGKTAPMADPDTNMNIQWNVSRADGPIELEGIYTIDPPLRLQNNGVVLDGEFREYEFNLMYVNNLKDIYGGIFGLGYVTGDENLKTLELHASGVLKNFVNAFDLDKNFLWAGGIDDTRFSETDRTGISRFDFRDGTWKYFDDYSIHELASGKIYDLDSKRGKLLAGTKEGLSYFNLEKNDWERFSVGDGLWDNEIKSVLIVDDTLAFAGSDFGLNEIHLKNGNVFRFPLTKSRRFIKVYKIVSGKNNYWIGTNTGIFAIGKNDKDVKHFDFTGKEIDRDANIAANCYAIAADGNYVIFKGENFFLKYNTVTNTWSNLPEYDFDSGVHDMDLQGKYLWIATNNGAGFLNIETEEWEKYGVIDGLAGARVFKVIIDGDWVWFGTDRGLTKYNWRKYVLE